MRIGMECGRISNEKCQEKKGTERKVMEKIGKVQEAEKRRVCRIGDFTLALVLPEGLELPETVRKFEIDRESIESTEQAGRKDTQPGKDKAAEVTTAEAAVQAIADYTYRIYAADNLPIPEGGRIQKHPDLEVYRSGMLESRLLGIKGREGFYALYQEKGENFAEVYLRKEWLDQMHHEVIFVSLLALERRFAKRGGLILHCAYLEYEGKAILFSAPSGTGKSTQAELWRQYRNGNVVNGDRALLMQKEGRFMAMGWPVCGTSGICENKELPVGAIVLLSQAKQNEVVRKKAAEAFVSLYGEITVNRWNKESLLQMIKQLEELLQTVPVYHLKCDISQLAVECLYQEMKKDQVIF